MFDFDVDVFVLFGGCIGCMQQYLFVYFEVGDQCGVFVVEWELEEFVVLGCCCEGLVFELCDEVGCVSDVLCQCMFVEYVDFGDYGVDGGWFQVGLDDFDFGKFRYGC